jgi:hypothetical protein
MQKKKNMENSLLGEATGFKVFSPQGVEKDTWKDFLMQKEKNLENSLLFSPRQFSF